ncbi:chromate transporter, partial [Diaphorobacter nitroreducens]|uniref:chromate transporter n=1 Tax=Diaphorobacter nitroreducens TaxID=164759 RepID=UPI00391839BA
MLARGASHPRATRNSDTRGFAPAACHPFLLSPPPATGPVAHLGYFREEFVARRGWLTEDAFADLVALCQFLPGPASSQVGLALGLRQAGWGGALAAWLGFTLPSALVMALLGLGLVAGQGLVPAGVLHGLKV